MKDNKFREPDLRRAVEEPEALSETKEDFEQIEDSLWEEYLQADEEAGINPERTLINLRMEQNMTVLLTFVITNIIYVIMLLLAWYIPAGFLYGCSIFEGAFIMTVVGGTLITASYDENHGTMHSVLVYFPVDTKNLRREMYMAVGKYLGMQLVLTCIPMLLMAFDFQPERFFLTILCNIGAMLVISTIFVEGSMHMMKARK